MCFVFAKCHILHFHFRFTHLPSKSIVKCDDDIFNDTKKFAFSRSLSPSPILSLSFSLSSTIRSHIVIKYCFIFNIQCCSMLIAFGLIVHSFVPYARYQFKSIDGSSIHSKKSHFPNLI